MAQLLSFSRSHSELLGALEMIKVCEPRKRERLYSDQVGAKRALSRLSALYRFAISVRSAAVAQSNA
jgi:hypothetical protein